MLYLWQRPKLFEAITFLGIVFPQLALYWFATPMISTSTLLMMHISVLSLLAIVNISLSNLDIKQVDKDCVPIDNFNDYPAQTLEIKSILQAACKQLSIKEPDLYIRTTDEDVFFAASALGRKGCIVVSQHALRAMKKKVFTNRAVKGAIAHELGHIVHNDSLLTLFAGCLTGLNLVTSSLAIALIALNLFNAVFATTLGSLFFGDFAFNLFWTSCAKLLSFSCITFASAPLFRSLGRAKEFFADRVSHSVCENAVIDYLKQSNGHRIKYIGINNVEDIYGNIWHDIRLRDIDSNVFGLKLTVIQYWFENLISFAKTKEEKEDLARNHKECKKIIQARIKNSILTKEAHKEFLQDVKKTIPKGGKEVLKIARIKEYFPEPRLFTPACNSKYWYSFEHLKDYVNSYRNTHPGYHQRKRALGIK